jgi:PPOX class probable F420-dependent enzyme
LDISEAREFVKKHGRVVLATKRSDGSPQLSPVLATVDDDGRVIISTTEPSVKVRNLRREPRAWLCVLNERFFGEWAQIEGSVEIVSLPEAMELLVDYYRRISGEHPDWDDYRAAMVRDRRVLVRVTIERAGPAGS